MSLDQHPLDPLDTRRKRTSVKKSADRSELVVTLPRYSPSSDVTVLDHEANDHVVSPDLGSLQSEPVSVCEENGSSSILNETKEPPPSLVSILGEDSEEFAGEDLFSVVVYQPKNDVIERRMHQLSEYAQTLKDAGDNVRAIISYTKAISLRPNDVTCIVQRAECFLRIADFQSAILNYRKACLLLPDNSSYQRRLAFIYYLYGQCLFDQKLYAFALDAFERASSIEKDNILFQYRSIACMAALGRHGECLSLVSRHLADRLPAPDGQAPQGLITDLYVIRARIHAIFGNTTLCFYDIRDALALDPSHSEASRILQVLEEKSVDLKDQSIRLTITGRNKDAVRRLTSAINVTPSNSELHINRGIVLRRLKDYNAAIDDFHLAINKAGGDKESDIYRRAQRQLLLTYNDFAVDCCRRQFFEEAIVLLNKAIDEEKNEKGLYLNRGDCFFRQGNAIFALSDYTQALEIDPADVTIHERIAEIHAYYASALFEERKYQEAEMKISLAIRYHPLSSLSYTLRSKAREVLTNVEGAQQDAILALFTDPRNLEVISLMARLFPGKSIRDIMTSPVALDLKKEFDRLTIGRKHQMPRNLRFSKAGDSENLFLNSLELKMEGEEVKVKQLAGSSLKASQLNLSGEGILQDTYREEKDFHLGLVKKKKKMKTLVHKAISNPLSLKNRLRPPQPPPAERHQRPWHGKTTSSTQQQLPAIKWHKLKLEASF